MADFLMPRAIPGVEMVDSDCYRRTIVVDETEGLIEVRPVSGKSYLLANIQTSRRTSPMPIAARLRRLLDLDADSNVIDGRLACDPILAARVAARPGGRVPGAWDGFELAVRAILGQQVSVGAATTFAGRVAALLGRPLGPHLLFPSPAIVAKADLTKVGLTRARAAAIRALGAAIAADPDLLQSRGTLEDTIDSLLRLPGVGPWTAEYIAMRALREPDAFPASDLGILRALSTDDERPTPTQSLTTANAWRPWRAYAAMRLWMQTTHG